MLARTAHPSEKLYQLIHKRSLLNENSPHKAEALLEIKQEIYTLLLRFPHYIGSYLAYARILRDLHETTAALEQYKFLENHAEAAFRYHWKTYLCHGIYLSELGHYVESIITLEKIIHFNKQEVPSHFWPTARQKAEAHNALAIVYEEQAKFDLRYEELHKAVKVDPTYAPAWSGLGKHYSNNPEQGSRKKAAECFENARKLNPARYDRLHPRPRSKLPAPEFSKVKLYSELDFPERESAPDTSLPCDFDLTSPQDFPPLPPARKRAQTDPNQHFSSSPFQASLSEFIANLKKQEIKTKVTPSAAPLKPLFKKRSLFLNPLKKPIRPLLQRALTTPLPEMPAPEVPPKKELKALSTEQTLKQLKETEHCIEVNLADEDAPVIHYPPARRRKSQPGSKLKSPPLKPKRVADKKKEKSEELKSGCWEKTKQGLGQLLELLSVFSPKAPASDLNLEKDTPPKMTLP